MSIDWELVLAVAVGAAMVALAVLVFFAGISTASGCLSIDVPPQTVLYNHDGDTFTVFTFAAGGAVKIRVEGVDTPEMSKRKGEPDEPGAQEAKEFTRQWLAKGPFQIATCGKPTLDRIVAKVSRAGESLADALRQANLAK